MRQKEFFKKLHLGKVTITNLNHSEMRAMRGGSTEAACTDDGQTKLTVHGPGCESGGEAPETESGSAVSNTCIINCPILL